MLSEPLIEAIYDSALFGGDWQPALERFRTALHSAETGLMDTRFDEIERRFFVLELKSSRHLCPSESEHRYAQHYARFDPKAAVFAAHRSDFLFNDMRHFDDDFVARDPFYQEFVLPLGMRHTLGLSMRAADGRTVFLSAMRPGRPFAPRDESFFLRVGRHFRRASRLRAQVAEAQERALHATVALDSLNYGILVIDERGRVALTNAFAQKATIGEPLHIRRGRLSAGSAAAARSLEALQSHALTGGAPAAPLQIPSEDGGYILWVLPLPATSPLSANRKPGALVVLRHRKTRLEIAPQELRILFGLTKAEAELALTLGEGGNLRSAALKRGISLATARTQLHWVLQKTGAQTQAELVRTLAAFSRPAQTT